METALVAPMFLSTVLFMFEYGLVFRDYLTVNDSIADAAKVGALQGGKLSSTGDSADFTIVSTIRQTAANIPQKWISRIVVFNAGPSTLGAPLNQVPALCKTGASSTILRCNVYSDTFTALYKAQTGDGNYFKCLSSGDIACGWPPTPTARPNGPKNANIEYVGVYIKLDRKLLTGLFGSTFTLEQAAIQRIEPGQLT